MAESARAKIRPPWQISSPLTMSGRMVMVTTAEPKSTSVISIPRLFEAASLAYIASAASRGRTVMANTLAHG